MWVKASILVVAGAVLLAGCGAPGMALSTDKRVETMGVSIHLAEGFDGAIGLIDELRFGEALTRLTELEPLVAGTGDVELAAACLFWQGFCQEKLSRLAPAVQLYRRVLEAYPQTRVAGPARRRLTSLEAVAPETP